MMFPLSSLVGEYYQFGLVVGVLVGFGFGFVLERAGFGRAPKLAAQFYLYDMTVFKVMFGAIVTAMLGLVVFDGVGLVDLRAVAAGAVSGTYIWPMLLGGLLLGAGFIISGYCPGTGLVSTASGNIDGLVAIVGVFFGSLLFAEVYPAIEGFYLSGDQGQMFLYEWLGISPAILAVVIATVAVAAFFGAEKVERIMTSKIAVAKTVVDEEVRSAPSPKRWAFGIYGGVAVIAIVTLLLPAPKSAEARVATANHIGVADLASRIFDSPWELRIIDVRPQQECAKQRIPGAECVPLAKLGEMGLQYSAGQRTMVLVDDKGLVQVPEPARLYKGEVRLLRGGHAAWQEFALKAPEPPAADASAAQLQDYKFRSAVNSALTGRKAAPAPLAPAKAYVPKKKKKEGGCG